MIDHKCALYWNGDKPEILFVFDNFEELDKELERHQLSTQKQVDSWTHEAQRAIEEGELYRGGGILTLAVLLKRHSAITSLREEMKHWER